MSPKRHPPVTSLEQPSARRFLVLLSLDLPLRPQLYASVARQAALCDACLGNSLSNGRMMPARTAKMLALVLEEL
jgi:hypothetical protein